MLRSERNKVSIKIITKCNEQEDDDWDENRERKTGKKVWLSFAYFLSSFN